MTDAKPELKRRTPAETTGSGEISVPAPEKRETAVEKSESNRPGPDGPEQPSHRPAPRPRPQHVLPPLRDPLTQKVEKILEENVAEAYNRLSPIAKEEFKLKGEVAAKKIGEMLKSTKIQVKKIFQLIFDWLKMLPGINKFFLEQEAKIKTDRIIALHNRK